MINRKNKEMSAYEQAYQDIPNRRLQIMLGVLIVLAIVLCELIVLLAVLGPKIDSDVLVWLRFFL